MHHKHFNSTRFSLTLTFFILSHHFHKIWDTFKIHPRSSYTRVQNQPDQNPPSQIQELLTNQGLWVAVIVKKTKKNSTVQNCLLLQKWLCEQKCLHAILYLCNFVPLCNNGLVKICTRAILYARAILDTTYLK